MNLPFEYEQQLRDLGQRLSGKGSLKAAIMRQINQNPQLAVRPMRVRGSLWMKIAAVIVALIGTAAVYMAVWSGGGGSAAFAEAVRQIQTARTLTYFTEVELPQQHMRGGYKTLVMEPNGLRQESPDGEIVIFDLGRKIGIHLDPRTKTADIIGEEGAEANVDPLEKMVNDLLKGRQHPIGQQRIGRVNAQGFRVTGAGKPDVTVWVDPATARLLQMEFELKSPRGLRKIQMSGFTFDTPLDESLFSIVPPMGYTMTFMAHSGMSTTSPKATSTTGSTATRPNSRAAAIQLLEREKNLDAFKDLLELNGGNPNEVVALLNPPFTMEGTEGVNVIQSAGQKYVVVLVSTFLGSEGAFIFRPQGDLIGRIGGTRLNDQLRLVNLGSREMWFIWLDEWKSKQAKPMESKVFFLKPGLPLALTFQPYDSGVAWTASGETIAGEMGILPSPKGTTAPLPLKGMGRDGKKHQSFIRWDESRQVFEGPESVKIDGKMVYRMEEQQSPAFQATDVP